MVFHVSWTLQLLSNHTRVDQVGDLSPSSDISSCFQTATACAKCSFLQDPKFTAQSSEPMEKLWDSLFVSCVIWWTIALTFEAEFQEALKSYQP